MVAGPHTLEYHTCALDTQPSLKIFQTLLKVLLTCSLVQCSRTCGKGWRKRAVSCKSTNPSARAQLLHDAACTAEPKPRTHEVCLLKRCHKHKKLQWLVSAWSQVCSSDSPQNSVSLFSPSCLLLPPLPSLCLLTLSEFSFRCFESVTSLSHGLRSPASLASMPTSLDIQSLFTMTLVTKEQRYPFSSLVQIREKMC